MTLTWKWDQASRSYGNYGNANQWTVNAGMASLARESAQNSNDARGDSSSADLVYTFIRLTGARRAEFEQMARWSELEKHLSAMGASATGAVTAGQIKAGVTAVRESEELILLQIADYGCRGLTGPEFRDVNPSEYGNFIKLCRLDLFSGKNEAAGGSFGLGKAVYWRFSRLQTVLFNSTLRAEDAVEGHTKNRLFGVNAGVIHDVGDQGFQGRGHFGVDSDGDIASTWVDRATAEALHVGREDGRPGTTALLLGFYDPDDPTGGGTSGAALIEIANKLRLGIEESFWPLLTRGRLKARVRVLDGDTMLMDEQVNPRDTFPELVLALERFDSGDVSDSLEEAPNSIVVRDIPIQISARKDGQKDHDTFTHHAKLVVALSDQQKDPLENSVCLLRKPEMVVQTVSREFEGRTFHGFLLAGGAIRPDSPDQADLLADDFLRFAEPPAHDRWIPGTGRYQASQANLTGRYAPPWVPHLKSIERNVVEALHDLFGTPPPTDSRGPEALLRNLRFLKKPGEPGGGGASAPRRPEVVITDWRVRNGRWEVTFELRARNRTEGWRIEPKLRFVGLDGKGTNVAWSSLSAVSGGEIHDDQIAFVAGAKRGRKVAGVFTGVSTDELPIPPEEAAIEVIVAQVHPPGPSGATKSADA